MKKPILVFLLFFLIKSYSQITFEKGYIITRENQRIECLIKNHDWINTPRQIEYKLSETSVVEKTDFEKIVTFQIYNTPHYYKKTDVSIDRYPTREVNQKQETVVLQVLLEGTVSLYVESSSTTFFYQQQEGEVRQLIYGRYVDVESKIRENSSFRAELYDNLKCSEINAQALRKTSYKKKSLVNLFEKYNRCIDSNYTDYTINHTKTQYKFNVLGGANFNTGMSPNVDFIIGGNNKRTFKTDSSIQPNIVLGVELEVLLPFNKNKWAIIVSPTFQTYKNKSSKVYHNALGDYYMVEVPSVGGVAETYLTYDFRLDTDYSYSYIELPIGVRHYFNLNGLSKLFADGSFGVIIHTKKPKESVDFERVTVNSSVPLRLDKDATKAKESLFMKLGVGYAFNEKYSVGLNYYLVKKLSNSSGGSFSIVASYALF